MRAHEFMEYGEPRDKYGSGKKRGITLRATDVTPSKPSDLDVSKLKPVKTALKPGAKSRDIPYSDDETTVDKDQGRI